MTTSRTHRCIHCKDVYIYHPSCYGEMFQFNDNQFCPECKEVVEKALNKIPIKCKKRFVSTTDYTKDEIVTAQETRMNNGVPTKRMQPCLFDLSQSSNSQENVCEQMRDPVSGQMIYYSATWWTKTPNKVEINKEIWWDIQNNIPSKYQDDL